MELELKHLASYLPYNLMCKYEGIINGGEISKHHRDTFKGEDWSNYKPIEPVIGEKIAPLKQIHVYKKFWDAKCGVFNSGLKRFYNGRDLFPILRPISEFGDSDDLRKVHEFIGIGKWCEVYDHYFDVWFNDLANIDKLVLQAPYEIFTYFLANHYDVFGLIPKGLAVNVNSIKV